MTSLLIYLSLLSVVSVWKVKSLSTFSDFFISDGKLGFFETSLTLMATWVDSAIILGFTGYCYLFGYDALWIAIPTSIGIYTFSIFFAARVNKIKSGFTVSGVIEEAYGEQVAVASSFFVFLYSVTLVSTNIMAGGHILRVMLGVPYETGALLVLLIAVLYTLIGGFKKVVETDIVQFFFVIGGLFVLVFFTLKMAGGWRAIFVDRGEFLRFSKWDIFSFFIIFTFPFWANPSFYQRCKAARSPEVATFGVAMVGLVDFAMTFVALIVGLAAVNLLGKGLSPDSVFSYMVKTVFSSSARSIVAVAVLSAVMSTADSYLLISGGILSHDMLRHLRVMNARAEVKYAKIGIVISAAVAFVGAILFNNIMEAAIFAFSLFVSSNLIPLVVAFYAESASSMKVPALLSMLSGGIAVVLWAMFSHRDVSVSVVYGLLISGLVFTFMYFITRRRGSAYVG